MQCGEFSILYCIYADISNYSLNYQKIYFDPKMTGGIQWSPVNGNVTCHSWFSPVIMSGMTGLAQRPDDCVHICTQSYTTAYIYVPSRIRQSTYMYPVVYGRVHICTYSYTTGYICVLCRVRPCVYIFANFDPYQFNLRTEDLTRIYPSWSTQRSYTFDHGQFPWCDRPPRAVRSYSWSTQRPYTFDHGQFPWCDHGRYQRTNITSRGV